ncbi:MULTISPECIES: aspartate-semialdehyde dehydrogenase [Dehalobacter]|jgi:aspartate-semialdehyde dehydrogenase|uniref:Aspartate-semialdehyde dehydrogenase n=2 Tax=Dehalobacter restrictus TaxID=55583 RepID=A0A857DJ97_9FIRM|nr:MULTISPECIES: aspartate-semialdehyde dehydrogenase [Dehalobacter]AHF09651.1 semialdehyde dehydrogenase [Dehalobacter restrictus DSM 9455]MCG1026517.1 aspartate-semialdehyde dehydrogenase [Dehalobacter sp.]MDJ0304306.1 aspartate-semialdehyde dehydrogenase [Dehalobacter sp.]OCZ54989.1 aspartate-semialdehyde dehydrogenase [Dehalobacter sp. TeCB1]QHA00246.1 aspartate-semialdehyde dehydrogenase [Dehalobacter restrictus]
MPNIAIVGATGVVGQEFLKILAERKFPVDELRLLATKRSSGSRISWQGKEIEVQETTNQSFQGIDIALFAGGSASTEYAPAAVQSGAVVIDNSSAFRLNPDVPLVVPEVNPEDVKWHKGIIANPNCSTIIMVVALKPLEALSRIKRIVVSTYQAVSGAGKEGIIELEEQVKSWSNGKKITDIDTFPYQIAFNLIPRIDVFQEGDYTKEEWKMVKETQKIFHRDDLRVTATCVRVPVFRSHCESINIETEKKLTIDQVKAAFAQAPGVILKDDSAKDIYPMPLDSSNRDEVLVGRIREDQTIDQGINLWIAGDQIRKGAATNAVQIAELLL